MPHRLVDREEVHHHYADAIGRLLWFTRILRTVRTLLPPIADGARSADVVSSPTVTVSTTELGELIRAALGEPVPLQVVRQRG